MPPHWPVVTLGKHLMIRKYPCNAFGKTEGLSAVGSYPTSSKARIGWISNNENDCNSCDSRIGFGTGGRHDDDNSCGNEATLSPDNGDRHIKAIGYIMIQ